MTERRVLVIYAHPDPASSRVNRVLIDAVRALPHVRVHDLYEAYPDLFIDRDAEQEQLLAADLIVFHFPMYWHSTPAILKEWQDVVLARGWAYGDGGMKLRDKDFLVVTTTAGAELGFGNDPANRYSMDAFLRPIEATAMICGLSCHPPFVVYGTRALKNDDVTPFAAKYRALLADYARLGGDALGTCS